MKRKKVLIAAGGTGGHLLPAQQLGELLESAEVCFAGYGLAKSPYFAQNRFAFFEIPSASPKKGLFRFVFALLFGCWKSLLLLLREKPDIIVGFGSYHSAPVLFAAAILRKKIIVFEANRQIGKVNRFIALFAQKIAAQFPLENYHSKKLVRVPLFPWIHKQVAKEEALQRYALEQNQPTMLVFGGSQGAAFLNENMPKVAAQLKKIQVIHFAGSEENARAVRQAYASLQIPAAVKAFETEMAAAYAAADFAVCRSGAGTISELIRYKVPSILIPYPHAAENHQMVNAEHLAKTGAAKVLAQNSASIERTLQEIENANFSYMRLAFQDQEEQTIDWKGLVLE